METSSLSESSSERFNRRIEIIFWVVLTVSLGYILVWLTIESTGSGKAAASNSEQESWLSQEFTMQINSERSARGLAPIEVNPTITIETFDYAKDMSDRQALEHSDYGRAEIIGKGQRTGQIMEAFMLSEGHRSLIVDPNLNKMGVGVSCDANGGVWVVVQFMRADNSLATLSQSPSAPIVSTSNLGSTCGERKNNEDLVSLYKAYFLRDPDRTGLSYWEGELLRGSTLDEISGFFAQSYEFNIRYGSLNNQEFVNLIYLNVMKREPDQSGANYWLGKLNQGLTRGQMTAIFSQSPEFRE